MSGIGVQKRGPKVAASAAVIRDEQVVV